MYMLSPRINVESIRVSDAGDLPQGLYFYFLVGVREDGSESYPHVIQVYANYRENLVSLFWECDFDVKEYRLYRGSSMEDIDGYFTIDGNEFHDNGLGVLNEFKGNLWL